MAKITQEQLEQHYQAGALMALDAVIERAVNIMRRCKSIRCFRMGMGTATFYRKDDSPIMDWERDYNKLIKKFDDFVNEWDGVYHITGQPLDIIRNPECEYGIEVKYL